MIYWEEHGYLSDGQVDWEMKKLHWPFVAAEFEDRRCWCSAEWSDGTSHDDDVTAGRILSQDAL